jgi:S1-C subfamily serine protease
LARSERLPVEEGQTILVIGSPEGLAGTVSNGIVAAIRQDPDLIQITAAVSPGSSGSPVLGEYGDVIAVVSEILKEGQNLNFAIPAKEVSKGMFAISGVNPHPVAKTQGQADQVLNDVIIKLVASPAGLTLTEMYNPETCHS